MQPLKVSTRLALLVALMSALLAAVGGLGLWSAASSNQALKSVYEDRTVPASQLGAIKAALFLDRVALAAAVLDPSPEVIKERLQQMDGNRMKVAGMWKDYTATSLTTEEARLVKDFAATLAALERDGLLPAASALRQGDIDTARRLATGTVRHLFRAAEPTLDALVQLQVDVARADYEAATQHAALARKASIGLVLASLVLGLGCTLWITRSLTRELGAEPHQAAALAASVAAGQLDVQIQLRAGDTRSLMAQLLRMRDSLREVVGQVRRNADSVATAAAQIAQGNNELSSRTEEQASALQQTAALMEQLNTTVAQNADHARQANALAQGASSVAVQGGEAVDQVVHTMREISASSRRIGDIIGVVDGIAFQTNILALNAAVEAARAGEQGRGFAVVAGEVRVLARRSAEAAREIKQLIGSSVERVDAGSHLADRAGSTMREAVQAIQRVTALVSEISNASTEQSSGVAQVGQAMTQMDATTQQNAALVEESAAAAASLSQQAGQLVVSVAVFQIGSGQPAPAAVPPPPPPSPAPRLGAAARPAVPRAAAPGVVPAGTRPVAVATAQEAGDWAAF